MTRLVFCGQAPSRVGDGRAFSGPSGRRLASLMGLRDYEELRSIAHLTNIFGSPQERARAIICRPRRSGKRSLGEQYELAHAGDEFDEELATIEAFGLLLAWMKRYQDTNERIVVVACGAKVFRAFTGKRKPMFRGVRLAPGVDIWHFPHPSGASHYWNDPSNVDRASRFLKKLLKRYEIRLIE